LLPSPGALPSLHSFPTRRSSDLLKDNTRILSDEDLRQLEGADQLISAADADRIQRRLENMAGAVKAMRDIFGDMGNPNAPMRERSEEHTSELQSRENLVCRLLLE